MDQLFKTIDVDGNGTIDFEEFLLLFKSKAKAKEAKTATSKDPDQKLMEIFDIDGTGYLSPSEWIQVRQMDNRVVNMAFTVPGKGAYQGLLLIKSAYYLVSAYKNKALLISIRDKNSIVYEPVPPPGDVSDGNPGHSGGGCRAVRPGGHQQGRQDQHQGVCHLYWLVKNICGKWLKIISAN